MQMKPRFFTQALITSLLAVAANPLSATVTINAGTVVRQIPAGIGGTGLQAHDNYFATNRDGIPYQSDLGLAGVGLVRTVTYPDFKATAHTLAYFDDQTSKILAQGAVPLFVMYIKPGTAFLKSDGTTGGTIESNIVYLVNHYKAAPYNLTTQYWEIHNEPEYTVDYQMTPAAYTAAFNSIHSALVAAGVRNNVILCGPASANDYGWGGGVGGSYDLMNTFLDNCKNAVDVVTRHIYIDDTDDWLLNNIDRIERQWNVQASAVAHGEALLQQTMDAKGVPATVMTGVTEYNTGNSSGPHGGGHSLVSGLWHLIALKYCIYNPRSALSTNFLFDSYGGGVGGYGCYDASKVRDYNWWALYIHGKRRGWTALGQTSTNSKLVVCATKDSNYLYVEVINRDVANTISDTVTINGAGIGQASLFKLSASQNTLLTGESSTYGSSFTYSFPSKSVTIFRYALNPVVGFETSEGYTAGQSIVGPLKWSGTAALFLTDAVGNGTPQGALSSAKTVSVSAYANVSRAAVAADFGGDAGPVTAGYTGLVSGSFDIAITESAATQDDTKAWFLRFGDAGEFELFLRANGLLEIRSTAGVILAKTAGGANFVLGSSYKTIRYTMDFATQTSQVWVDGVAQTTPTGGLSIPWQATPANAKFSYVRFQNNVETTNARYNRIKVDNIAYSK